MIGAPMTMLAIRWGAGCERRTSQCLIGEKVGWISSGAAHNHRVRVHEPFSLLMGQLAYGGSAGPEIAYQFERLDA